MSTRELKKKFNLVFQFKLGLYCFTSVVNTIFSSVFSKMAKAKLNSLGSVDNSPSETRRPAACPREQEIVLNVQHDCIERVRTGSRGQAASRRNLNFQQALVLITLFFTQLTVAYTHEVESGNTFLVISDVHLDSSTKHSMDFMPSRTSSINDMDEPTYQQLITNIADDIQQGIIPEPKFILYLGDIVGHDRATSNSVKYSENSFFTILAKQFPNTPILYTFGNNDSFKVNYGPFTSIDKDGEFQSPLDIVKSVPEWTGGFMSIGGSCEPTMSDLPCVITDNVTDGYYSAYIEAKFRLISLNSVMLAPRSSGVSMDVVAGQFSWLEQQLKEAKFNHESVLLTMHIPPGKNVYDDSSFWRPEENTEFLRLVNLYKNNIVGILAGHTHKDEIKLIQDSSHNNLVGVYLTPALSTSHGNAPSIRTYSYARSNDRWSLTDYVTYYFSKQSDSSLILKKLYDFREYYCKNQEQDMLKCLSNLSVQAIERYFSAGNENYQEKISYPQDLIIQ